MVFSFCVSTTKLFAQWKGKKLSNSEIEMRQGRIQDFLEGGGDFQKNSKILTTFFLG